MNFLGNIGIDPWLLVAQIVNFVLLIFILRKFLYKPILKKFENQKLEIEQKEKEKELLDSKIATLKKQQNEDLSQSKTNAQRIITEAEKLAREITRKAQQESDFQLKESQVKLEQSNSLRNQEALAKFQKEFEQSFHQKIYEILDYTLDQNIKRVLLQKYCSDFLNQIEELPKNSLPTNSTDTIFFVATYPSLNQTQKDQLQNVFSEKIGKQLELEEILDPRLLAGLHVEFAGVALDANLHFAINKSLENIEFKK